MLVTLASKTELNLFIAQTIEPVDELERHVFAAQVHDLPVRYRAWRLGYQLLQPVDFEGSVEGFDFLLEQPSFRRIESYTTVTGERKYAVCFDDGHRWVEHKGLDRKRTTAEGFALANGWKKTE